MQFKLHFTYQLSTLVTLSKVKMHEIFLKEFTKSKTQ